jgi:EpsD family peptidyl-prolyl cis-trans isomerase
MSKPKSMSKPKRTSRLAINPAFGAVALAALLLSGCGKKNADGPPGQVVGHVDGEDITVQEIQNEFRHARIPADKQDDAVTRKILTEIVTRKALAHEAVAAKLDRQPTVLLDLFRDRENLLAQALLQRRLSTQIAAIGQTDIDQYIAAHPLRFAQRAIIQTDHIQIPPQNVTPQVGAATKDAKTLAEVELALAQLKIPMKKSSGALDTALLPEKISEQLEAKKTDNVFFARTPAGGDFFTVTSIQPKPLTGAEAAKLAKEMIAREKLEAIEKTEQGDALKGATFEGRYADVMQDETKK